MALRCPSPSASAALAPGAWGAPPTAAAPGNRELRAPSPPVREAALDRSEAPSGRLRKTCLVTLRGAAGEGFRLRAEDLLVDARTLPGAVPIQKRGPRAVVRLPAPSVGAPELAGRPTLVLKEEVYPFPMLLRGIAAPPRALGELRNLALLRSLDFPAVEPLACGWAATCGLPTRSFLLLEDFAGSVTLKDWARAASPDVSRRIARADIVDALRGLIRGVARLHAAGVSIGTLYAKNILARSGPGGIELRLCDVPRARGPAASAVGFGPAAHDLACLDKWACEALASEERRGILDAYLEELGAGPPPEAWMAAIRRRRDRLRHRTPSGRASRGWKRLLKR